MGAPGSGRSLILKRRTSMLPLVKRLFLWLFAQLCHAEKISV